MTVDPVSQQVRFDRELIDRYDRSGPRYTSYPTAPHFHEGFGPQQFQDEVAASATRDPHRPLSLYVHIPFCDTVCYYCGCNRTVTPDRSRAARYLEYLLRETVQVGNLFQRHRRVVQLHLGGGTPTYLTGEQLSRLMAGIADHFSLEEPDRREFGIEVDPREMPPGTVATLGRIGFNRLSIGVQDLDPRVQKAVNRVQPEILTRRVMAEARDNGFQSINLDLIYGLPLQTADSFSRTLEQVVRNLNPDRLAVFNYAHLPQYFSPQRRINAADLPSPDEKLRILERTIHFLTGAGYVYVGMDHFAKPGDELAVSQRQGRLHRNFQGYTTHAECDLVGLGTTAISQVGESYAQNVKDLETYYRRIDAGELAVFRGLQLSRDDIIRRETIMRLICDFQLDRQRLGDRLGIDFDRYFQAERPILERMVAEGLLEEAGSLLRVTPAGRLLIRNICMAFDWYLANAAQTKTFSRTI
ncbi:MAG: oxygen-independent coproporphyrinogen III oxidase [Magnetococcales bacterium]|nr:oxygen-independent coproporphyrinogen III oxidase [Magnetococcales bacterium]